MTTPLPATDATAIDGALVVDKPAGPTSHDIVARVRRILSGRRVGHTGTLDPFATGVLPLLIGRGTRLARFLTADRKSYRATLRLGLSTTTDDLDGDPVAGSGGPLPAPAQVLEALSTFRGRFEQRPPVYSAKKVAGSPAYARARRHEPVTLAPVAVETFRLDAEAIDGDRVVLLVECSSGFYVRALARDLGEALGCGAHLTALRRVRCGAFAASQAVTLETLGALPPAQWPLVPLAGLVAWLPAAHLAEDAVERVAHGNAIPLGDVINWEPGNGGETSPGAGAADAAGPAVRLLAPDGGLVAIARGPTDPASSAGFLQPFVVLV